MKEHDMSGPSVQRSITDAIFDYEGLFSAPDIASTLGRGGSQYAHDVISRMGCVHEVGMEPRHRKPAKLYTVDADPTRWCVGCVLYDRNGACQNSRRQGEDGEGQRVNGTDGRTTIELTPEEWQEYLRMLEEGHTGRLTDRRGRPIQPIATIQEDGTLG